MRFALFLLAFVAVVFAQQEVCDNKPYDGSKPVDTFVGYTLNFDVPKNKVNGSWIKYDLTNQLVNDVLPLNTSIYFEINRLSTAELATVAILISDAVDGLQIPVDSGSIWTTKHVSLNNQMGLVINKNKPILYAQVIVACTACSKTAEFTVKTTLTSGANKRYLDLYLQPDVRSATFDTVTATPTPASTQTNWVVFFHTFTEADMKKTNDTLGLDIFFDVTFPGVSDTSSEVVAYHSVGTPPDMSSEHYPINKQTGNWLQEKPFTAVPGKNYFAFYTKANTAGDVDYTIKAGFGDYPCSMASGLVANILLLALIPFTLFMNKF